MKKLSEEHKQKLRDNHVGMLGKKHSLETILKMRHKHKSMPESAKEKLRIIRLGTKLSISTKEKISNSLKGKNWKGGKPRCMVCKVQLTTYKAKKCTAHKGMKGKDSHFWKGGITPINQIIRTSYQYKQWRKAVYTRDNFTCQMCKKRNGNGKSIILNADHIKPFALFPELRFELSNGRTLCRECHKTTDTYGRYLRFRKEFICEKVREFYA